MKVLLITPPMEKGGTGPPLGLGYIATYLEKNGFKIRIIDIQAMEYNLRDIKKEIKKFDPNIIGLSGLTQTVNKSYDIAKFAKKNNPNCILLIGGPHPTALPKQTLNECKFIDIVVKGEGEITFIELIDNLQKNKDFIDINGIAYRDNQKIIENPNRHLIENLDNIPFPAFHLLPMKEYYYKNKKSPNYLESFSYTITSRGCPYNCSFCSTSKIFGKKVRFRSPQNVVEELRLLTDKYKIKSLMFMDDTFTLDKKRVFEICNLIIKEKIDINWHCLTRVEHFNRKIAKIMKKSGCDKISFGFESGVQKILNFLNKNFTIDDSKKATRIAYEEEINALGNFIIGVPGETKDMINQTIDFSKKLNLSFAGFCLLTPYPGTKIYDYAKKNNLLLTEDWSKFTYDNPIIKLNGLSKRYLKKIVQKANNYYKP